MRLAALPHLVCSNCGSSDTATLLAAIASIVVAVATFGVVVVSYRAASAAVRSARATEGLLAAQLGPRIIDVEAADDVGPGSDPAMRPGASSTLSRPNIGHVEVGVDAHERLGFCSVPVRNVGAGLARIRSARVEVRLKGAVARRVSTTMETWNASKRFLPAGETTRIAFMIQVEVDEQVVHALPYATKIGAGVTLHVRYSAAESEEEIETTFVLRRPELSGWRVVAVFHSDLAEAPRRERLTRSEPT